MLTFVVAVVTADTDVAPDSSSLVELLLAPEILSMADVAAVNGCSKNLFCVRERITKPMKGREMKWNEKLIRLRTTSKLEIAVRATKPIVFCFCEEM